MTSAEHRYVERVKALPCSICGTGGPSEAHEIRQGQYFTSVALCPDCHRDQTLGIHGQKRMWKIRKMDELDALSVTIKWLNT